VDAKSHNSTMKFANGMPRPDRRSRMPFLARPPPAPKCAQNPCGRIDEYQIAQHREGCFVVDDSIGSAADCVYSPLSPPASSPKAPSAARHVERAGVRRLNRNVMGRPSVLLAPCEIRRHGNQSLGRMRRHGEAPPSPPPPPPYSDLISHAAGGALSSRGVLPERPVPRFRLIAAAASGQSL